MGFLNIQDEIVFPEARTAPIRNPCYSIAQQFFVSLYGSNFLSRDDVNNDELSILTVNDSLKSALIELDRLVRHSEISSSAVWLISLYCFAF